MFTLNKKLVWMYADFYFLTLEKTYLKDVGQKRNIWTQIP